MLCLDGRAQSASTAGRASPDSEQQARLQLRTPAPDPTVAHGSGAEPTGLGDLHRLTGANAERSRSFIILRPQSTKELWDEACAAGPDGVPAENVHLL
jgi:hypothetical protein